eukprot:CAMPEP_0181193174 /NCGR_PEP_ID=MMETSP1096-20121128/13676_1 /TAXON_ID=156174 ORGANISM="Chrysochromulina ericina, Strain CCMP281" /NCGR_SAMPLE_ID=MMETSP1096 /ASSEMBLY_ACC=CAM_ASM_000453 /LENGTH=126 /DNA_ID=CAMNT_0023282619 /DNA_START=2346 /DNA_END=2726 /DNA_ORIENTATION=+
MTAYSMRHIVVVLVPLSPLKRQVQQAPSHPRGSQGIPMPPFFGDCSDLNHANHVKDERFREGQVGGRERCHGADQAHEKHCCGKPDRGGNTQGEAKIRPSSNAVTPPQYQPEQALHDDEARSTNLA